MAILRVEGARAGGLDARKTTDTFTDIFARGLGTSYTDIKYIQRLPREPFRKVTAGRSRYSIPMSANSVSNVVV